MSINNTTLLGLAQPVTGQESGVWGDDVNNGLTELVEIAIAGVNNITQDSDITLAVSNGSNSSSFTSTATNSTVAQYYVLNCSGSRTAARNIIVPTTSKTYVITNATTGGYAITIKKSAGTGVTIANGETAIVFYNTISGDVAKVSSLNTFGAITATSITNSGLTSGRVVYSTTGGLETDSANFTFNGTTATINTLNLTNALGTAYGGTGLTSFTANGVVYASSTSALATGSGLVFDGTNLGVGVTPSAWNSSLKALQVGSTGMVYYNSGNVGFGNNLYVNAGSNVTYITTAPASLLYQDSSSQFRFYQAASGTAGTTATLIQAMTLDNSGNLGIGTTSPQTKLHVSEGVIRVGATAAGSSLGTYEFSYTGSAAFASIQAVRVTNNTTSNMVFSTASSGTLAEAMRIDASGNLGLGVTPSAWGTYKGLDINTYGAIAAYSGGVGVFANAYFNGTNSIYKQTAASTQYNQNGGQHQWYNAPSGTAGNAITFTQAMTLDNSGRLMVGATSSSSAGIKIGSQYGGISLDGGGATYAQFGGSYGIYPRANVGLGIASSVAISFEVNGTQGGSATEAARIDISGNLLVGVSSYNAAVNSNYFLYGSGLVSVGHVSGTSSGSVFQQFVYNATQIGSITQSGTTAVAYNTSSDQRLKTDLGQVTSTNVIDNTIVHDFFWKTDGTQSRGVFAQEAYKVIPQAVKVGDDGEEVEDAWGVDYSKYVPDLIVYCQQLKAEIQSLKAEIATLKGA